MMNQTLIPELQHEAANTIKILKVVPEEKLDWRPHDKSMTLGRLASHLADMPHWMTVVLTTGELNFATSTYRTTIATSTKQLVQQFEEQYHKALDTLKNASDEVLKGKWTMRNGDRILFELPRIAALRFFAMSHLIHHRGQLSVYLRLLDVPVPGMYGPSADENF